MLEGWGTRPTIGFKSEDIDLVTEYDKRSEALVVARLARLSPAIASSPKRGPPSAGGGGARVWYVDPLDGTTNFAHGFPLFSVSLGLCVDGRPVLGVVTRPPWDGRSRARRPAAARRQRQPIAPSHTDRLVGALLVTGFPTSAIPSRTTWRSGRR